MLDSLIHYDYDYNISEIQILLLSFPDFPWDKFFIGSIKNNSVKIYNKDDLKLRLDKKIIYKDKNNNGWVIVNNNITLVLSKFTKCFDIKSALILDPIIYDFEERKRYFLVRPTIYKTIDIPSIEIDYNNHYSVLRLITKKIKYYTPSEYRYCYVCRDIIYIGGTHIHFPSMCKKCGEFNYKNRQLKANLSGTTALVTGGRQKIGYKTSLSLLRCGAKVIVTTRYPMAAKYNYLLEKDQEEWFDNLTIIKADFRKKEDLDNLISTIQDNFSLNIIINNACQTLRPSKKYSNNINYLEQTLTDINIKLITDGKNNNYRKDLINISEDYNLPKYINKFNDVDEDISIKYESSWKKQITEIESSEFVETMLVNQFAPTYIIQKLLPTMNNKEKQYFIINVTAIEGDFSRCKGGGFHVHTNMCKAALNMLTRTLVESAKMNQSFYSIDPGFVSGVNLNSDFPLKTEDAAARILYPIINYYNGKPLRHGSYAWLMKDYYFI